MEVNELKELFTQMQKDSARFAKVKVRLDGVNPKDDDYELDTAEALQEMRDRYSRGQITRQELRAWLKDKIDSLKAAERLIDEVVEMCSSTNNDRIR